MTATHTTTVSVFPTRLQAEQAVAELKANGFYSDQIGLIGKNAEGDTIHHTSKNDNAAEGAAVGAAAGAAAGAAIGAGIVAGMIPVIGPVLAIGTLGTILLNAVGGAAAASLAGALIGWGIPDDEADFYESEVAAGRFLVTVEADDRVDRAQEILERNGGESRTPSIGSGFMPIP